MKYIQCKCVKQENFSQKIMFTWLPEKYAVKGKFLKLKINDRWEESWKVAVVYSGLKFSKGRVKEQEGYHKTHRRGSDI